VAIFELKSHAYGESYLHTIIFCMLVQNGFGNPYRCKVGQLPKKMEEIIGWMKITTSGRPKVASSVRRLYF
jgi:hypothetical protein